MATEQRLQKLQNQQAPGTHTSLHSLSHRFFSPLVSELRLFLAPAHLYLPVKAAILAHGHAVAASQVLAAVLVNHIRRVLAPWLGQFLWWHPVQEMKLARATPHYFVEEQLLGAGDRGREAVTLLLFWLAQKSLLAATRALLRHRLLADTCAAAAAAAAATTTTATAADSADASSSLSASTAVGTKGRRESSGHGRTVPAEKKRALPLPTATWHTDCYRILYLTLCLMQVEYAYAEACWAVSCMYATTHVFLRGTRAEREFTHRLLRTGARGASRSDDDCPGSYMLGHCCRLLLIAGLLLWWAWHVPLQVSRRHGVVAVALSGLAVLGAMIVAGTAHIVRYSNKYFMWLEMSEVLVTWVWMVLGAALVAAWRLSGGSGSPTKEPRRHLERNEAVPSKVIQGNNNAVI